MKEYIKTEKDLDEYASIFPKLTELEHQMDILQYGGDKEKYLFFREEKTMEFDLGETLLKESENCRWGNMAADVTSKEPWPDPISFDDYSLLPDFPSEFLPSLGREMVETVAEVNQVDIGMVAGCYLAILSIALAKKAEVDLITHREPLNLFINNIAESGHRKSSTLNAISLPIYEYQKERGVEIEPEITEALTEHKIREKRLAKIQDECAKAKDLEEQRRLSEEAKFLALEINKNPVPKKPVYICDDVTTEALAGLMADNNERIGVVSAEGGIFSILAGLYSEKNVNFDIALKGHAGDPWACHRIGRGAKSMERPSLTMCLCVQPEVIREIGRNRKFRGKGLLARFLYCHCKPQVGFRERQFKNIPDSLKESFAGHIKALMDIPLPDEPALLRLSGDGQRLWDEFYNDDEISMRPGGELESLKDWGSKLPGAVARIAGLLHLAKYGTHGFNKPISAGIAGVSCAIGAYYKDHALAAFGVMGENPKIEAAKKALEYIKAHKPLMFKGRDILAYKFALKTMEEVNAGLKILMERSFIKETFNPKKKEGRPESTTYEVNPKLFLEC